MEFYKFNLILQSNLLYYSQMNIEQCLDCHSSIPTLSDALSSIGPTFPLFLDSQQPDEAIVLPIWDFAKNHAELTTIRSALQDEAFIRYYADDERFQAVADRIGQDYSIALDKMIGPDGIEELHPDVVSFITTQADGDLETERELTEYYKTNRNARAEIITYEFAGLVNISPDFDDCNRLLEEIDRRESRNSQ
jgi:hypothetical protein